MKFCSMSLILLSKQFTDRLIVIIKPVLMLLVTESESFCGGFLQTVTDGVPFSSKL